MLRHALLAGIGTIAAALTGGTTFAQTSSIIEVGGPFRTVSGPVVQIDPIVLCQRYHVCPVHGNDGNPGTLRFPFRTLTHAMEAAAPPAVIMLLPGIYSDSTNGETWPLQMRDRVSIQGTSILDTVLDGTTSSGFRRDVLFFQGSDGDNAFETVQYDAFMIRGANRAIFIQEEIGNFRPTFSNLVLTQNEVGIEMIAIDLQNDEVPSDSDGNRFVELRPRIVNCTIVGNDIGILDHIWILDGEPGDFVFGEAEPIILNCLILGNHDSDLEGVDGTDLVHTVFCTFNQAGISALKPGKPAPQTHVDLCDIPNFELDIVLNNLFVNRSLLDFRLTPFLDAILPGIGYTGVVDQGTTDVAGAHMNDPATTPLRTVFPCGQKLFDFDGERYGNPRVAGAAIDIGADELGSFIVGGYKPMTRSFGIDADTGIAYTTASIWIGSGLIVSGVTTNTGWQRWLPATVPGVRPGGTTVPTSFGDLGDLMIDPATLFPPAAVQGWWPAAPLSMPLPVVTQDLRQNLQFLPVVDGVTGELSNLQSFIVEE